MAEKENTDLIDLSGGPRKWLARQDIITTLSEVLPGDIDGKAFIGQCLIALQDDALRVCDSQSQFQAVHTCATLGLLPTLDQVALIPRAKKVDVMPQWQGYKALMERHPAVLEVTPYLVHKTDTYTFSGGRMSHDYDPFSTKRSINSLADIVGGYAVIQYVDGRQPKIFTVTAEYIGKCAKCAQTQNVWKTWFEQQALKTVLRACYSRRAVPIDPFAEKALKALTVRDDAFLENDPTRFSGARSNIKVADLARPTVVTTNESDAHPGDAEAADAEQHLSAQTPAPERTESTETSADDSGMDEAEKAFVAASERICAARTSRERQEALDYAESKGVTGNAMTMLKTQANEAADAARKR